MAIPSQWLTFPGMTLRLLLSGYQVESAMILDSPAEAEWEFAARAGAKTTFYFGDDESQLCRYANIADRAALMLKGFSDSYTGCNDGYQATAPVGSFVPNRFGLYDMIGNAWEWTSTLYSLAGYVSPEKLTEAKDKGRWYAIRGGAWNLKPLHARVADRYGRVPEHRTVGIGFRLVMTR
jgi:formylglycine-generating enzyme required for sulfatase activity